MNQYSWPSQGTLLGDEKHALDLLQPQSIAALQDDVLRCAAEQAAIYPRGGATALEYGGVPARPGYAVCTRHINRVIDYPAADMTITVEAGISLANLQNLLAREKQRFPLDPPQPDLATLGGIFATNASGPRRFGLGKPRDLVIGISFVTADGKLIHGGGRVVKNVAGYDFPRLLTGSMGTLGIITELTLKVRPIPETSALVLASIEHKKLAPLLTALNTSATRPVALELLNSSAAHAAFAYNLQDPNHILLVLGFEGFEDAVQWQLDTARAELKPHALQIDSISAHHAAQAWNALAEFPARPDVGPLSFRAVLQPSRLEPFLARLDPQLWSWQASAGDGVVHAHIRENLSGSRACDLVKPLRGMLRPNHEHLMITRCLKDWKSRLKVWGPHNDDWFIMNRIKHALDPADILNPGRFIVNINV